MFEYIVLSLNSIFPVIRFNKHFSQCLITEKTLGMSTLQYSSWDSGDISKKKKVPAFGKPTSPPLMDTNDLEIREPMTDNKETAEKAQNKIHELLEKMNQENFQDLATAVEPIPPPVLVQKGSPENGGENKRPPLYATPDSRIDALANYRTIYSGKTTYQPDYPVVSQVNSKSVNNDVLLEKLNYMIYLLEQQQNEKTDNVLEEFILYCFLGVFIIYVIDAFARSGNNGIRYVR